MRYNTFSEMLKNQTERDAQKSQTRRDAKE